MHGGEADTARGGVDEDPVTLLDAGPDDEGAVAGGRGDEEARGLLEAPARGHGQQRDLGGAQLGGEGALRGAEDAGPDGELGRRRPRGGLLGRGDYRAGELGAGDPGES